MPSPLFSAQERMRTLLLTRSETEVLIEPNTLLADLRSAFRSYSVDRGVRAQRVRSVLPGPGTATVLFPGTAADIPAYTVKVHAKFPEQQPAIRGVLCLNDGQTGELLAVMDSTHLTAVRTGLCSALAADVLARRDARSVVSRRVCYRSDRGDSAHSRRLMCQTRRARVRLRR
jgi:ornithine cyclodeaminase/alanine dehydrogenase-like protein (mu-crystallin family)